MVISHGYVSLPEVNMSIMGKSQESMRGYGDINGKSIGTNRDTQIMGLRENYRKHQETIRVSIIKIKSWEFSQILPSAISQLFPMSPCDWGNNAVQISTFLLKQHHGQLPPPPRGSLLRHTFEALAVVDVVTSQDLRQVCQVCVTCKFAYLVVQLLA